MRDVIFYVCATALPCTVGGWTMLWVSCAFCVDGRAPVLSPERGESPCKNGGVPWSSASSTCTEYMRPLCATSTVSGGLLETWLSNIHFTFTSSLQDVPSHFSFSSRAHTVSASRAECVQDIEAALRRDMENTQTRRLADAPHLGQRQADKETPEALLVQKRVGCTFTRSRALHPLHTHQQQPL
jgi:hypothetical protein